MNPLHPLPGYFMPHHFLITLGSLVDVYSDATNRGVWFFVWDGDDGAWFLIPERLWNNGPPFSRDIEDQLIAYANLIS